MLIGRWKTVSRNQVNLVQEEPDKGKIKESQVFEGNHIMGKGAFGLNWSQLAMPVMVTMLCQTVAIPAFADVGAATNANKNDRHTAEEANIFFSKLAKDSANPVIASMAQENVKKLAEKAENYNQLANAPTFAETAGSKSTHSVSLVTQANNSLAIPTIINRKTMGTFVLDTGATYTVITPRLARKLGVTIDSGNRVAIATANGVIQAPIVTLKSVTIGDVEVNNVQAIVQNLGDDLLLAGLLGMNFFKGMDMSVRQDKLILSVAH